MARVEKKRNACRMLVGKRKERVNLEYFGDNGRILLKNLETIKWESLD